uniref:Uncharacterized protein n=1 Tax=Triatoma infestans TaxID=30076 RepID=A0A023EYT4_TRIIF
MSNPLSREIVKQLDERGVPTVSVPGFRHTRPKPLTKFVKQDVEVLKVIDEVVPPKLKENIKGYIHSSHVDDLSLQAAGYTVLTEKEPLTHDFDTFYMMFVRMALESPRVEQSDPGAVDPAVLMSQQVTSSSAGLLPLNTAFGNPVGNKKEMQASATSVNIYDSGVFLPGCLPAKPAPKDEVLKRGKKVRTIMVESESNFQILKHFFEDQVSRTRDVVGGSAIGLSSMGGGFKSIFFNWYWVFLKYFPDTPWNEFCEWLDKQFADESDKTAWESSTNMVDGMTFLIELLVSLPVVSDKISRKLLARALADYANPPVQIDSDKVYFAPWRVCSGSYFTAKGNTRRHWYFVQFVCDFVELHDHHFGGLDCSCNWCKKLCALEGFGTPITKFQLDMIRACIILGDDFLAINDKPVFGLFIDAIFGTTTKTHFKKIFSTPSLEEPEGAEFLKKHFFLDKTFATFNIRSFRAPTRLLAKLSLGRSTESRSTFKAAVLSAIWECGYNKPLYDILADLFKKIQVDDPQRFNKALQKYVKRSPGCCDAPYTYLPEFATVVNSDASMIKPLETVWWGRITKRLFGLPLNMY